METLSGMDRISLIQIQGDVSNAFKVAFQTDNETDESRDYSTEPTLDGPVKSVGTYEATHSISSFMAKGDPYIKKLKGLVRKPAALYHWNIERADLPEAGGTIPGEWSKCMVTSVNTSNDADGNVEVSIDLEVEGYIVDGEVNVTAELLALLKQIAEEQEFVQPTLGGA